MVPEFTVVPNYCEIDYTPEIGPDLTCDGDVISIPNILKPLELSWFWNKD